MQSKTTTNAPSIGKETYTVESRLTGIHEKGTVELSMPNYVKNALQRFQHPQPTKPQKAPSKYTAPMYGTKGPQYNKAEDMLKEQRSYSNES